MIIYPAMDLLQGKCVRLYQGDYNQATAYSNDPITVAKQFEQEGAKWLHIVDLQGAKDPYNRQIELICSIIGQTGLSVQTGGGIRSQNGIEDLLSIGVKRVMVGSLAVNNVPLVQQWLAHYGDQILLALDVRLNEQGVPMVATSGWQNTSHVSLFDLIAKYLPYGLTAMLCTDIGVDGTLKGSNTGLYSDITRRYPHINCIASGGVGSLTDVQALQQTGVAGVVIGKALYEKRFSLQQALQ